MSMASQKCPGPRFKALDFTQKYLRDLEKNLGVKVKIIIKKRSMSIGLKN